MNETVTTMDHKSIRQLVLNWSKKNQRHLPWRDAGDPYHVWISEIMLQQTTVAAVIPYFERFLKSFPTIQALANANEADVLRHWEGLGYYSRARNLKKAAQQVMQEFGGALPSDVSQLQQLSGIGRYTAGAIASFGFGKPAPIVEANTERLYARLMGIETEVRTSAVQKQLWAFAEQTVSPTRPGRFNQAVMDLGSQVCTPKQPRCETCPLASHCIAFANELQDSIPKFKPKAKPTEVLEVAVVIRDRQKTLFRQCGDGERWAGLWDVPRWNVESPSEELWRLAQQHSRSNGRSSKSKIPQLPLGQQSVDEELIDAMGGIAELEARTGCQLQHIHLLTALRHAVTRYKITLLVFEATLVRQNDPNRWQPQRWLKRKEIDSTPLCVTGRKIVEIM